MDLQSVLNRAWDLIKEVKVRLEQARENKDQCQQIVRHRIDGRSSPSVWSACLGLALGERLGGGARPFVPVP